MTAISTNTLNINQNNMIYLLQLFLAIFIVSFLALPIFITFMAIVLSITSSGHINLFNVIISRILSGTLITASLTASAILFPILSAYLFFVKKQTAGKSRKEARKKLIIHGAIFPSALIFIFAIIFMLFSHDMSKIVMLVLIIFAAPTGIVCAIIGDLLAPKGICDN